MARAPGTSRRDAAATLKRDDDLSRDEYELALDEGVEDDTLNEGGSVRHFEISSYGADYTVDSIVKRMRAGAFKIPEFQRDFVWTLRHASKFIESLLMGLPVPGIFLYKEANTNSHLVIDGQQRLRTLQAFYDEVFKNKPFRLEGVREPWDGKTYSELSPSDSLKLDDAVVHATIFKQDQPRDVLDSIYFVFERINTGGIRLSPQEIRNCISVGRFTEMVKRANQHNSWRTIFGPLNPRKKDEELILRFFALLEFGEEYERPMNTFLNDASDKLNRRSVRSIRQMERMFGHLVDLILGSIGRRAFRLVRTLNAAVFDAVMVGLAARFKENTDVSAVRLKRSYDRLLSNPEFRQACERATADEESVRLRITLATEAFARL